MDFAKWVLYTVLTAVMTAYAGKLVADLSGYRKCVRCWRLTRRTIPRTLEFQDSRYGRDTRIPACRRHKGIIRTGRSDPACSYESFLTNAV